MGILLIWICVLIVVLVLLTRSNNNNEKEMPHYDNEEFEFDGDISEAEFKKIVRKATKNIKRIERVNVTGPVVEAEVLASSGISNWSFRIDFDDNGELTGEYKLESGNEQSRIPGAVAEKIRTEIIMYQPFEESKDQKYSYEKTYDEYGYGDKQSNPQILKCVHCNFVQKIDPYNIQKYCSRCGYKCYFDTDQVEWIVSERYKKYMSEANIRREEEQTKRKEMELKYKEREDKRDFKRFLLLIVLILVLFVALFLMSLISG